MSNGLKFYKYSFRSPEITYCAVCPCYEFDEKTCRSYCRQEMRRIDPSEYVFNTIPRWCKLKKEECEGEGSEYAKDKTKNKAYKDSDNNQQKNYPV